MESNQKILILRKITGALVMAIAIAAVITLKSLAQRDVMPEEPTIAAYETEPVKTIATAVLLNAPAAEGQGEEALSNKEPLSRAMLTTPVASKYSNQILANVNESLNIRNNPSPEGEIVGKMYNGTGGDILEQTSGWTKVRSGAVEGWVSDEYLIFGDSIETKAKDLGLIKAVITTETLKVRKTAEPDAVVLGLAALDESYQVLEETDGWIQIQYTAGDAGYISSGYARVELQIGKAMTLEEEQAIQKAAADKEAARKVKESANDSDVQLLAACVMMEAGGYSYEGQLAVANVVLNRVRSGRWGSSISSVIYAKGQFPGAANGKLAKHLAAGPSQTALRAVNDAMNGVNNIGDYLFFNSTSRADYGSYSQYVVLDGNCFYKK